MGNVMSGFHSIVSWWSRNKRRLGPGPGLIHRGGSFAETDPLNRWRQFHLTDHHLHAHLKTLPSPVLCLYYFFFFLRKSHNKEGDSVGGCLSETEPHWYPGWPGRQEQPAPQPGESTAPGVGKESDPSFSFLTWETGRRKPTSRGFPEEHRGEGTKNPPESSWHRAGASLSSHLLFARWGN